MSAVSFRGLVVVYPSLLLLLFSSGQAALRTHYAEELCDGRPYTELNLRNHQSGILASVGSDLTPEECTIRLTTAFQSSIVLSIYRYNLGPADRLVIEDSERFKVALIGEGDFPDERKSFLSDSFMTIRYTRNSTLQPGRGLKFQFVFTRVHEEPCNRFEFRCRNRKCVPMDLVCDRHNHCGDNSDQEDCGPRNNLQTVVTVKNQSRVWMISIIVASVIFGIVVLAFAAFLIRGAIKKKKKNKGTSSVPGEHVAPPPQQASSVFARIRQSFRGHPKTPSRAAASEEPKSENYQVPSMYPQIPSAPHFSEGVVNPDFKIDV